MATVTVTQVREMCAAEISIAAINDTVITSYIAAVNSKVGSCLDTSYDADLAPVIQLLTICHLLALLKSDRVKSFKAPNGTSFSYESYLDRDSLGLTGFGKQILMLDDKGCVSNAFAPPFFAQSVGSDNPSIYPNRNRGEVS